MCMHMYMYIYIYIYIHVCIYIDIISTAKLELGGINRYLLGSHKIMSSSRENHNPPKKWGILISIKIVARVTCTNLKRTPRECINLSRGTKLKPKYLIGCALKPSEAPLNECLIC